MNNIFDKKNVLAKITLTLKNFLLDVKLVKNNQILADIECFWQKNNQKYLIHVTNKLSQNDLEKELFKQSLVYCKTHGMKFIVVAVEYDNTLFEHALDSSEQKEFKIIPYNRLSNLNSDFFASKSSSDELYSYLKNKILKAA